MAQRIYHESRQDGRSVLGMLAVHVEKDPKTGATIVRSVTPVSAPADPQSAPTIFDDGRKSIHAVGASAAQPSSEELGQILSAIDGVGMTALLNDVTITTTPKTTKVEDTKRSQGKVLSSNQAMSTENRSKGVNLKEKVEAGNMTKAIDASEVTQKTLVADGAQKVEVAESEMLCEGPVTLVFMGYTDGRSEEEGLGEEEPQGMLTAERVIITDEGEELVLGQDSAAPPQKPPEQVAVQEAAKESRDRQVFQDVPLEGKSERAPEQAEDGNGQQKSNSIAEGQGKPKRKTCQCCTVM